MKNKKPYKEKEKIKTNEAHNCRVSVPFNVRKPVMDESISSRDNFHRTEKVAPSTTRSLWEQYPDVKNRKTSNYSHERNNLDRIKSPLKQHVARKDLFHKTDGKFAPSFNSATCTPRRLYSDVWNTNVSRELRNNHDQLNCILKIKPQEKVASSVQRSVRLWSVHLDAEAVTSASDQQRQDCCETKENNVPESALKEFEEVIAQSSNSEASARSNNFYCNEILMVVANAMVVFVLSAMQPIYSEVKAQLGKIERNQRIKHCSSILIIVANAMVVYVLGSMKPVCSYGKVQLANIEIRQRINQCSCMLMTVANAMMGVVLGAMQSLWENRRGIKDVVFGLLWRAIRVLNDLISSAVTAMKLFISRIHAAVSQLKASRQSKKENISHEITCASSNMRKDLERDKATGVHEAHQAALTAETVPDQPCVTNPLSVKTEGTYPTSHQGYSQFSDVMQNPTTKNDGQPVPQRTGVSLHAQANKSQRCNIGQQKSRFLKEKIKLNVSPTVGHAYLPGPGESQAKVSTKGKLKKKGSLSSVLPSNVVGPVSATVDKKKKQKKVATAAHVDLPVTTSVAVKSNEKALPRLISPSYVNVVARAKARAQEIRSPRVGLSNLVLPAKVSEESMTSSPRNSDSKSSGELQEVIKRTVSRAKRPSTESEKISTDVQASKSFLSQCAFSMTVPRAPTEIMQKPVRRISQPSTQKSHSFAVEQPEFVEVDESVDKPFSITWPEEMEVCQEEPSAANTIFTAPIESASASTNAELEIEEMETVQEQASVWNFFSFSLPSFLAAPFKFPLSEEEMEVEEQTVPVTPSNSEKVWKWNASAQQETMEISQQQVNRPVASPFRELVDTKRPLASTVGLFGETASPEKVMPAEQHMMQSVTQRQVMHPAMQSVMQTVTQSAMQPSRQSLMQPFAHQWTQPVMQHKTQPAMQSVIQPVVQPAMQQMMKSEMQRPLVQQATQPNVEPKVSLSQKPIIDYSTILEYNSAVETRLDNEGSAEGEPETATGRTLTSEVRRQETTSKSRDQLIMEQLQLVPPTDPACYLADGSDSDSGGDSDEEYELDLETIEKFSELESCPDHAQFITKLLIEKEATEWHNVSNSDSGSDCDGKQELLSEFLDSEIGKYSELDDVLDSSPEHVERLAKLVAEKESSLRQCNV